MKLVWPLTFALPLAFLEPKCGDWSYGSHLVTQRPKHEDKRSIILEMVESGSLMLAIACL